MQIEKTTRRSFFALLAGAVAAALVRPEPVQAAASIPFNINARGSYEWLPILYGNGVADDTAALQCLIDGGRVWCARTNRVLDSTICGDPVKLNAGTYRVSTLFCGPLIDDEQPADGGLVCSGDGNVMIEDCTLIGVNEGIRLEHAFGSFPCGEMVT